MTHDTYPALVVRTDDGLTRRVEQLSMDALPPGDLLVRVDYSSLNYKDALSANGNRGVTRAYPHTPGIDAAGVVVESRNPAWRAGDAVIVSGFDLGMNTAGGFGRYVRVPAEWAVTMPAGLDAFQAMVLGTAGFTAALALQRLQSLGLTPDAGEVLVTGASGGVGTLAIALLAKLGFSVAAATGKPELRDLFLQLGASAILDRRELEQDGHKALLRQRWAAAIDTVGGPILAGVIKSMRANGLVAACGNAASPELALTVYPFILRGVSLLGIDAATCSLDLRNELWGKLAGDWRVNLPDALVTVTDLAGLPAHIERTLQGLQAGRVVVSHQSDRP